MAVCLMHRYRGLAVLVLQVQCFSRRSVHL
jgi:hypothetical protein